MAYIPAKDHPAFAMTKKAQGIQTESEARLQKQICAYLKAAYPDVLFISTLNGEKLGKGQAVAVAALQSDRGIPDLFVFEKRRGYQGLVLELKKEGVKLFTKDLRYTSEHIAEQAAYLEKLKKQGYYSAFSVGFEKTKSIIDWYLS